MNRLIYALALPLAACQTASDSNALASRISQIEAELLPIVLLEGEPVATASLEQRMEHYNVPAVSIAVIKEFEIEWARAYGMADIAEGRAATTQTLFQAASISKPVAATAALTLVEEGALTLDGDVNQWLSSWTVPQNRFNESQPVTLRGLVTHSAGMTVHGFPGYARDDVIPSTVGVLDGEGNTDPIRVDTTPGAIWRYSGGGYTVVQLLVADVVGESFPQVLQDRVLEPFGMTLSTYEQPLPESRHGEAATGYRSDGTEVETKWHVYPEMAAAGLWTTPSDLARWALGILAVYHGRSDTVLDQQTARDMLTPGIGNWGLGPTVGDDGLYFGHGGSNEGFRCRLVAFIESGDGLAVMTNSDNGGYLYQEIVGTVANAYDWPVLKPETRVVASIDPSLYEELEGEYEIASVEVTLTLEASEGRLWIDIPDNPRDELLPESEFEFFTRSDGTRVTFVREGDVVTALTVSGYEAMRR